MPANDTLNVMPSADDKERPGEVLAAFLKLGLTSFGGPIAHLGYFREEFVARRGWIDDRFYADLVALCQFLPGPASSPGRLRIWACSVPDRRVRWPPGWRLPCLPPCCCCCSRSERGAFSGPLGIGGIARVETGGRVAIVAQAVWGDGAHALPPTAHARRSRSPPS
jgi:chromate transporter